MNIIKKDILDSRILIIEDDYLGRSMIKGILRKSGFINIEEAENGKEGLVKVRNFRPDLIILDVIMPEMDGVECCKRIRGDADIRIANIPIIFQTSLSGVADKARFFEAGATGYICKPVEPNELAARAVVHLEREVMNRHLRDFKIRMSHELNTARHTQQILIPDDNEIHEMEKYYKMQICGYYQSSSELGGDFWGFKSLSHDELAIYMVDFSGHGVNAALNVFRLHALMQAATSIAHTPSAYLTHLNAILTPLLPTGQFATMFYGVINQKKKTLSYASAAAPSPILFRQKGKAQQALESTGTVLGALKESSYNMVETEFDSTDCLMLYSDALIETPNEHGDMQPIENWVQSFQSRLKTDGDGCRESFASLLANFRQHCGSQMIDDLSLNIYYMR